MREIDPTTWLVQPWKNGGGITREITRWPATGEYEVRVSLADVECNGPFSTFPGFRRWTVLVAGSIRVGDRELRVVGDFVELQGDVEIEAAGQATLLNVIARAGTHVGVGVPIAAVRFAFTLSDRRAFRADAGEHFDRYSVWIA